MKDMTIHYVGKVISPEQFIAEHTFEYVIKGSMNGYDGSTQITLEAGECCIARKNRLGRYNKENETMLPIIASTIYLANRIIPRE